MWSEWIARVAFHQSRVVDSYGSESYRARGIGKRPSFAYIYICYIHPELRMLASPDPGISKYIKLLLRSMTCTTISDANPDIAGIGVTLH